MNQISYVTGNIHKFEVARKVLDTFEIEVVQENLETPEIQSTDVEEIAKYSARFAANKLEKPVVVTDAGWYIEALQGFPGPFIKYINQWLSSEDLLKLMEGKRNRNIEIRISLAYCEPEKNPIAFTSIAHGTISQQAVNSEKETNTSINKIFIPEGYDKVESEISREEMVNYWSKSETIWTDLAKYMKQMK